MLVIFTVALISAVLSTIDSAILAPASVLAQNVFERFNRRRVRSLTLNRLAILVVTAGSVGMAYLGKSAYALLEDAYELPLVGLFVPLALGLRSKSPRERAAVASMLAGTRAYGFSTTPPIGTISWNHWRSAGNCFSPSLSAPRSPAYSPTGSAAPAE
jgi:Na+/proline symporter